MDMCEQLGRNREACSWEAVQDVVAAQLLRRSQR